MSKGYYQYNNQHNMDYYDEDEADEWRHRQIQKKETKYDEYEERSAPKRNPDEVWLVNKFFFIFSF